MLPEHLNISKTAALAFAIGILLAGKGIRLKLDNNDKSDMYIAHGVGLIAMAGIGQHTKKIGLM